MNTVTELHPIVLLVGVFLFGLPAGAEPVTYRNARPDYQWSFPDDHGAHPSYRTEWWYFTGQLEGDDGARVGFQFTIFRQGTGVKPAGENPWMTDQVLLGHMAVSVPSSETHREEMVMSRRREGLAGADTSRPGTVRIRTWRLSWKDGHWMIRAHQGDLRLHLNLEPSGPVLFQGPNGFSRKGEGGGQASSYYSFTRLKTTGTVSWNGGEFKGRGRTWFDHEFGSSQLGDRLTGWDWISLRLSDGTDVMVYRLRKKGGAASEHSQLTLRDPDGDVTYLGPGDWTMTPVRRWTSLETGARYPVRWRLTVPSENLRLTIEPPFDAQEMVFQAPVTDPYWEGMIRAEGTRGEASVKGEGYLEMTGYAGSFEGRF